MGAINFNYNGAMNGADELSDIANQIKSLANGTYENNIQNVSAAWTGDSAGMYITKSMEMQEELIRIAEKLEKAADDVRTQARIMKAAEEEAERIANEISSAWDSAVDFVTGG